MAFTDIARPDWKNTSSACAGNIRSSALLLPKVKSLARQAGIIDVEAPLHLSNVMLVCPHCNKPTRVGHRLLPTGGKVRMCKKCQSDIT